MMSLLASSLRLHKILGYALGILFLMWFVSGIVMLFCRYPRVSAEQKLEHGVALDTRYELNSEIMRHKDPVAITLEDFGAGPVLRIDGRDLLISEKSADKRLVASWWGNEIVAVDTMTSMDVWLLGRMPSESDFPIVKYTYSDGNELYVSQPTSEPMQFSSRAQRLGAWFGAVPHWLYITPLRSLGRGPWGWVIIVLSLAGVFMVVLGLAAGIIVSVKSRHRIGRWSPYRTRIKRWHHICGCVFGIFVLSWIFSGYMSMISLPDWIIAKPDKNKMPVLEKVLPQKFTLGYDMAIGMYDDVRKLTWLEIAGEPVYKVDTADGAVHLVHAAGMRAGLPFIIDEDVCRRIVGTDAEVEIIDRYDMHYMSLRGDLPLPVYRISVATEHGLVIYINPADVSVKVSSTNGVMRGFLYRGLHCLAFPFMAYLPHLRIVVMLVFLLLGLFIVVTGLMQIKKK